MHVLLNPIGSAGDVHPFVGLGLGLRERGHRVSFLISPHFRPLIERLGFESIDLGTDEDFLQMMRNPDLWHPIRGFAAVCRTIIETLPILYQAIASRYVPGETAVVTGSLGVGARVAHEKLGVPLAMLHLQPSLFRSVHETSVYPGFRFPSHTPRIFKRLFYRVGDALVVDPQLSSGLNAFRRRLGLPPVKRPIHHWFHAPDLVLGMFPPWFFPIQPDWPPQTRLVGFPLYDERGVEPLSPDLANFLNEGEAPIVITPGSANLFGHRFLAEAAAACRLLDRRGLLLTRHAEQVPADLPAGVIHRPFVPFSHLLPRAAALVHHGGIGTMAQAMAAGIPQLIQPLAYDQFDNADRTLRLGVGRSLAPSHFRAEAVAATLSELTGSAEVQANCHQVATRFRDSDPIGDACRALEESWSRSVRVVPVSE